LDYLYETIEHNSHIPIKIFTHTIDNYPYHWHEDTEILFVLKGEIEITVENVTSHLYEGNVFIINNNALHYINAVNEEGKAKLLALQFDINHFSQYKLDVSKLQFNLKYEKKGASKRIAYNQVRGILASMMKVVINNEEPRQLVIERHLLDLMIVLINNFKSESARRIDSGSGEERLMEIIKYISSNCKDHGLSLDSIAEHFHLSSQYLSRYFKNRMGISLKKFLDNMRMNKSLQSLKVSDERIIDIALRYGFPDAKAYYRVFRSTMNMTPAEYRELHKLETKPKAIADYFSINSKETLSKLFEYIGGYKNTFNLRSEDKKVLEIKTNKSLRKVPKSITKLMTFGYAPHGLRSDFEEQLVNIQKDIQFDYVRFHGIFSDDMMFFNVKPNGEIYYNYNHIDWLFDVLLKHGLKPFLELGYMPKEMASSDQIIFHFESNVTPPKELALWTNMIADFMKHIINRYGIEEVLSWYFEFWNEPDFGVFFRGSEDEFYDMFKATYKVIKNIDSRLQVGGFGTMNLLSGREWLKRFTSKAKVDQLQLDFFSFHIYQHTFESDEHELDLTDQLINVDHGAGFTEFAKTIFDMDIDVSLGGPECFTESVDLMIKANMELEFAKSDYYITEWNSSADSRDLVHDTCFIASYIVKSVLQNAHKVLGMGFWTATDIFEEFRLEQPMFHGGFGLMTYNGIKKPGFHAYAFLSQLKGFVVYQEEGIIVTKHLDDYQILLYNYAHYNDLYQHFDHSQISMTNRYDVFQEQKALDYTLVLKSVAGKYCIEKQWVNRQKGSAFDAWVDMGAPDKIGHKGLEYLKTFSEPGYSVETKLFKENTKLDFHLEPHEIQLIHLQKLR